MTYDIESFIHLTFCLKMLFYPWTNKQSLSGLTDSFKNTVSFKDETYDCLWVSHLIIYSSTLIFFKVRVDSFRNATPLLCLSRLNSLFCFGFVWISNGRAKIHKLFVYKTKLNQTSYLWNCYIKSIPFSQSCWWSENQQSCYSLVIRNNTLLVILLNCQ